MAPHRFVIPTEVGGVAEAHFSHGVKATVQRQMSRCTYLVQMLPPNLLPKEQLKEIERHPRKKRKSFKTKY